MIDIGKIDRIEAIIKQERELSNERALLSSDVNCNRDMLQRIYEEAKVLGATYSWSMGQMREYYLFVVVFVFDPAALVKQLKRGGIREDVASVMGITINNVSHLIRTLLFHYRLYKDFRKAVEELHEKSIPIIYGQHIS